MSRNSHIDVIDTVVLFTTSNCRVIYANYRFLGTNKELQNMFQSFQDQRTRIPKTELVEHKSEGPPKSGCKITLVIPGGPPRVTSSHWGGTKFEKNDGQKDKKNKVASEIAKADAVGDSSRSFPSPAVPSSQLPRLVSQKNCLCRRKNLVKREFTPSSIHIWQSTLKEWSRRRTKGTD